MYHIIHALPLYLVTYCSICPSAFQVRIPRLISDTDTVNHGLRKILLHHRPLDRPGPPHVPQGDSRPRAHALAQGALAATGARTAERGARLVGRGRRSAVGALAEAGHVEFPATSRTRARAEAIDVHQLVEDDELDAELDGVGKRLRAGFVHPVAAVDFDHEHDVQDDAQDVEVDQEPLGVLGVGGIGWQEHLTGRPDVDDGDQ